MLGPLSPVMLSPKSEPITFSNPPSVSAPAEVVPGAIVTLRTSVIPLALVLVTPE